MIRGMSLPIPTKGGRAASGQYSGLICPACNGGSHEEPSFAVKVCVDVGLASACQWDVGSEGVFVW